MGSIIALLVSVAPVEFVEPVVPRVVRSEGEAARSASLSETPRLPTRSPLEVLDARIDELKRPALGLRVLAGIGGAAAAVPFAYALAISVLVVGAVISEIPALAIFAPVIWMFGMFGGLANVPVALWVIAGAGSMVALAAVIAENQVTTATAAERTELLRQRRALQNAAMAPEPAVPALTF